MDVILVDDLDARAIYRDADRNEIGFGEAPS
jgi:hypothetical protein